MTGDCPIVEKMETEYFLKETGAPIALEDHQRRVLNHFFTLTPQGKLPYTTYVYSTPKKEGKTEVAGAVSYAWLRLYGGDCISAANDKEGARARMFVRVVETLLEIKRRKPSLYAKVVHESCLERGYRGTRDHSEIEFNASGQANLGPHVLRAVPGDYAGEAGALIGLVTFDELWGYSSESLNRLYTELQPQPASPFSARLITTYAGYYGESELLWNIYDTVVKPDPQTDEERGQRVPELEDLPVYVHPESGTVAYWDHENRMPWKTAEFLDRARNDPALKGREGEYLRLWENRWSTGSQPFLPTELIDRIMARGEALGLVNHMPAEAA